MTRSQSLIFYPNLHSRLVIQHHKPIYFCCQPNHNLVVELWSNLSLDKTWHPFPFTPSLYDHQLVIETSLPPGDYEYTFRFKPSEDAPWSWYGRHNENGRISIVSASPAVIQPKLPDPLCLVAKQRTDAVDLWHFRTQHSSTCIVGHFNRDSFVACIKKGSCWLMPSVDVDHDQQWQLLLCQDKGIVFLWIVGQDGWLSPGPSDTIHLNHHHGDLIIASTSHMDSITSLIQTAFSYLTRSINKVVTGKDSVMLNKLGYCTWDAFGKSVNADKINQALQSLERNEIPVAYIMIDDGWQNVNNKQQLLSMDARHDKFPGGLKQTVSTIKSKYPFIESVGVWHTLWGYWNGTEEGFSKAYGGYQSINNNDAIGLVHNPDQFYCDFYSFLKHSNIDFVKVDNQGSFQDLNVPDKINVWDTYRQSVAKQADVFLCGQVVHSMALTPHIVFHPILSQNSIFRNSDDFFPHEKDSHAWHIYANAINALWTCNLIGDWDMFQSDHPFAEYHASSRAISGGPIYITDEPDKHDATLLSRLMGQTKRHGYSILRSEQAPQPTFNTIFGSPMKHESILGLCNFHGEYNVRGFWNTSKHDQLSIVTTNVNRTIAYVVSGLDKGKVKVIGLKEFLSVRVKGLSSCLVSISPIHSLGPFSISCLGLIDKFNGIRAVFKSTCDDDFEVQLTHRGCCGFWMDIKPKKVVLEDQLVKIDWSEKDGLLKVDMMVVPLNLTSNDLFSIRISIV